MNWKIESHPIDVAEITPADTQNIYLVTLLDDGGRPIAAKEAYGQEHRGEVTRELITKYNQYITKIEHSEEFKQ
tara:strand:- start:55 stop:276 length:222 start_codon:yes stop_codon:yes gene_type:complete